MLFDAVPRPGFVARLRLSPRLGRIFFKKQTSNQLDAQLVIAICEKNYKADSTELNNAPDPMKFLNDYLKKENPNQKAADYIVPLTGKAYLYSENVTLQKGDIVIPEDYGNGVPEDNKNKKVYVYIGDKDLPLTNETLSNKDEKENFTTLEHKPKDKDNKTYNFTLNP